MQRSGWVCLRAHGEVGAPDRSRTRLYRVIKAQRRGFIIRLGLALGCQRAGGSAGGPAVLVLLFASSTCHGNA